MWWKANKIKCGYERANVWKIPTHTLAVSASLFERKQHSSVVKQTDQPWALNRCSSSENKRRIMFSPGDIINPSRIIILNPTNDCGACWVVCVCLKTTKLCHLGFVEKDTSSKHCVWQRERKAIQNTMEDAQCKFHHWKKLFICI